MSRRSKTASTTHLTSARARRWVLLSAHTPEASLWINLLTVSLSEEESTAIFKQTFDADWLHRQNIFTYELCEPRVNTAKTSNTNLTTHIKVTRHCPTSSIVLYNTMLSVCVRNKDCICIQCCRMMLLCWSTVLLCLSASAEHTVVYRVSGESVTLECSFAESPYSNDELIGMYLYHDAKTQEEVLYYHSSPGVEKISPRVRYSKRVEKKGSLENHTITISNLTVEDSGIYRCVYKKNAQSEDIRNVYILVVSEKESEPDGSEKYLPLVLIISVTSVVSIMVTMIFIWLIVPKVKQWTSSRRIRNVPQQSNECVYEVLTKNGFQSSHR